LAELPLTLPWQHPDSYSGMHLYVVRLQLEKMAKSHRQVFKELLELGIGVNLHYIPVHTQPHYKRMGFKSGSYPKAEQYYAEAISIPMYAGLTESEQMNVISSLQRACK
jgi:dTDP-4-amino-4,6-dideoxygalactose transaminase